MMLPRSPDKGWPPLLPLTRSPLRRERVRGNSHLRDLRPIPDFVIRYDLPLCHPERSEGTAFEGAQVTTQTLRSAQSDRCGRSCVYSILSSFINPPGVRYASSYRPPLDPLPPLRSRFL